MKNIFFISLLFLIVINVTAQENNNQFQILDIITKVPVANANICIKNTTISTISNDEGIFQMSDNKESEIMISHLEYKKFFTKLSQVDQTRIIYLEPLTNELEEIIVTKEPIHDLLYKAIENSKSKFNLPIILNTYYREFVKVNDKYTRFTDGLIDYHMTGSKANLIVNQSRAAKLISDDDETLDLASGLDVRHATTKQYSFYTIEKILFDSKNFEDYDFELKSKTEKSGNELYIINFKPKSGLKKYLYNGTVAFDPNTYLISDLEISSDQSNIQYSKVINILIIKASVLDLHVKTSYKINNGIYLLAFSSRRGKIKIWNKRKYNDTLEYKSDLVVTNFQQEDFSYNKKETFNNRSLYERGNKYSEKFWLKNNSMVLTDEELKIIQKLEMETNPNN